MHPSLAICQHWGVIRSLWPLFHVSNEVKFTINKIFRNETSLVEPSWVELYGQVTVRSPWSTFYAWLTLDNFVTYMNYTILYPTQWVGGILESPCPSVRHNLLQLSHWTDWFQICYAASHIWGICCKQFQLLSDINFLFCWILNFSVYVINDSKYFRHKNLGSHWLNRFQILYAVSYWWGIRCKQFWLLSDINFLLSRTWNKWGYT